MLNRPDYRRTIFKGADPGATYGSIPFDFNDAYHLSCDDVTTTQVLNVAYGIEPPHPTATARPGEGEGTPNRMPPPFKPLSQGRKARSRAGWVGG